MSDREPMKNDVPELWRQRAKAGLCPVCGKTPQEFDKGMRVYCSHKCRDKYASKYTFWTTERNNFLKEHGKICDICGTTPEKIKEHNEDGYKKAVEEWLKNPRNKKILEEKRDERLVEISKDFEERYNKVMDDFVFLDWAMWDEGRKLKQEYDIRVGFEVDHILALCNGGDMWDKNNWQVLCDECHKKKTRQDLKERKRIKNKTEKLIEI